MPQLHIASSISTREKELGEGALSEKAFGEKAFGEKALGEKALGEKARERPVQEQLKPLAARTVKNYAERII